MLHAKFNLLVAVVCRRTRKKWMLARPVR